MTKLYGTTEIEEAAKSNLVVWPTPHSTPFWVHLEHPEFASLCPRSGYPDTGLIVVDYVPDELVVELKSFKLYVNSFMSTHISHEAVVNEIADRFTRDVLPKQVRVIGDFRRRGGIKTVVTVYRGSQVLPFNEYLPQVL